MKSLSSFNDTAIDNPHVDVIRLLQIEFSGLTLYLCDRVWGSAGSECEFNSQLYEPLVLQWNDIQCGKIDPVSYQTTPSGTQVVIDNNTPVGGATRFASLFSDYDPHYVVVTISEIFNGASAAGDKIDIFKGQIEDILDMETDKITLTCTGFELDIANKFSFDVVEADTYPDADPDYIGKMLPQAYGEAEKVPFMAVDAGNFNTTSASLTDSATTVSLHDASLFASSGTVQVEAEQMTYAAKSGNSLTGLTRGVNSTTAAAHDAGSVIAEIQTTYTYIIGHAVKAIDTIYVDNIKQESSIYTAYTGQTGDENSSYPGKACIVFNTLPTLLRQTVVVDNIGVSDTIDVVDTITVTNTLDTADQRFTFYLEATETNIGKLESLDVNSHILDYDTTTTITFQSAPAGTLSDIYVEYSYEFREIGTPVFTADRDFYLDGILIASYKSDSGFTEYQESPIRVYKASWPSTATKSVSWRSANMQGIIFNVLSAKVYCTSTTNDGTERGGTQSRGATNDPVGAITSETTVDSASTITFPAAPSGSLSDIKITVSWSYNSVGPVIGNTPRHFAIDGINVVHLADDGTATALMPSTFTILQGSWQTSITKTASYMTQYNRGQQFLVSVAEQSCYSLTYSTAVVLTGDVTKGGSATKTGAASKTGSVTGNSISDIVIGTVISADLQGYQDDGSGTYTGTANALIEYPDHVFKHILINRCGLTSSEIDATSYNASGTHFSANSITIAPVFLENPNIRTVLGELAYQCSSIEFWEAGTHHLVYLVDKEDADKTIEANRIDLDSIQVNYTDRVDILNSFSSKYDYEWSGYDSDDKAYRAVALATSAGSITKYGTLESSPKLFPAIPRSRHAIATTHWIRDSLDYPRLLVDLTGGYYLTDIERGDVLDFIFTSGDVMDKALLELVTSESDQFMVMDMVRREEGISLSMVAMDSRPPAGVMNIIQVSVTSAANAGTVTVATTMTQACIVEAVVVRADVGQTSDLTSIGLFAGTSNIYTFFSSILQSDLNATDKQEGWVGKLMLVPADKIKMVLTGTGATAVDVTVTIAYRPVYIGGYIE